MANWYWWAKGEVIGKDGRRWELVRGYWMTENDASLECSNVFLREPELRLLPTKNEQRAKRFFKTNKFERGMDISDAMQRMRSRGKDINIE